MYIRIHTYIFHYYTTGHLRRSKSDAIGDLRNFLCAIISADALALQRHLFRSDAPRGSTLDLALDWVTRRLLKSDGIELCVT